MSFRKRLWNPYVIVFLSNACIMVIELVASRLIAPRVGVSLYTWTSVIGVILAGISIGNALGGRLADRWASTTLLGSVLSAAALSSLLILWLNNDLHTWQPPVAIPLIAWIILYIAAVFMLPSVILGCVSPIVAKLSITSLARSGRTVGQIYAWSSVGSIAGTFLTGFGLIAWFGTKTTVLMVAGLLLLMGMWFLTDTSWRKALVRAVIVLLLAGLGYWGLQRQGFLCPECLHSYSDLEDPTNLAYGYEQTYAEILRPLTAKDPDMSFFFIGGGGYTFPRYLETVAPESEIEVAEIDPDVTAAAERWLGLSPDTRIITHNYDARLFLERESPEASYDVVVGDAFNDYSVPYHLTTREFTETIARVLRKDGIYMANIIDGGPYGNFFRAYVATVESVFPYVAVIPSLTQWQEAIRSTFVVMASRQPLPIEGLTGRFRPLAPEQLHEYMAAEPHVILTDDYVPVDNLMAPVVEASWQDMSLTPDIVARVRSRVCAVAIGAGILVLAGVGYALWRRRERRNVKETT